MRYRPALLLVLAAACGYTQGNGLRQQGIRTIALTAVGNDTYRQRLEVELGLALSRELPVSSGLMISSARDADATLHVVFTDARERTLVTGSRNDPVREGAFSAGVRMRLIRRDGRIVIDQLIADRTEFRTPIGENLTSARGELVGDLARKIAQALEPRF